MSRTYIGQITETVNAVTAACGPVLLYGENIDTVVGVNVVGMRRAGLSHAQIDAVREAFKVVFRDNLVLPAALAALERDLGGVDVVAELIAFLRQSHRGISPMRGRLRDAA